MADKRQIDWNRVGDRFQRWYTANQGRFHDCMFTEDDIACEAFYAGIESAMRKPPVMDGQEDVSGDRC